MAWRTKLTLHLTGYGLDPERLEAECNRMSDRGWQLKHYGALFSRYRRGEPNEYEYRTLVVKDAGMEKLEYTAALAELGIEEVGSRGEVLILRRKTDGTPFELFSDLDSRIAQQKKMRRYLCGKLIISLCWALIMAMNLLWFLRGIGMIGVCESGYSESLSAELMLTLLMLLALLIIGAVSAIDCARGLLHSKKLLKRLEAERVVQE